MKNNQTSILNTSPDKSMAAPLKGALMQSAAPLESFLPSIYKDAIFHLSFKTIRRKKDQSVIPKAAYNSAQALACEDGSYVWDYRRKSDVLFSEIVCPLGVPAYFFIRQELWMEVCRAEKRTNSVEAREAEGRIPNEIRLDDAIKIGRRFAKALVKTHGVIVDFNIHLDHTHDWRGAKKVARGMHIHFLMTTRRATSSGLGEKTRELDTRSSKCITHWRVYWQDLLNEYLELQGSTSRVSCLSNKARGIAKKPTIPLGPSQTALERRGIHTIVGDYNRSVKGYSDQSE